MSNVNEDRLQHEGNRNRIMSFVDDLRELWKKAGRPGDIIRQAPFNEEAEFPRITYRVIRRLRNQDFKDVKPRYRTTVEHPYEPGNFVELWGQIFDVYVEFEVFAKTQTEADDLLEEFEEFLNLYKGTFKNRGVQEITFYAQGEDKSFELGRMQLATRTLQYTVRLERITPKVLNDIQQIDLGVSVRNI